MTELFKKPSPKTIPEIVQKWELGLISGDEAMEFLIKCVSEEKKQVE